MAYGSHTLLPFLVRRYNNDVCFFSCIFRHVIRYLFFIYMFENTIKPTKITPKTNTVYYTNWEVAIGKNSCRHRLAYIDYGTNDPTTEVHSYRSSMIRIYFSLIFLILRLSNTVDCIFRTTTTRVL